MIDDVKFFISVGLVCGIFVAASLMLIFLTDEAACKSQWAHSGMKSEWGPIKGCLVQRKDGTWVPSSAIRDVNQ